MSPSGSVVASIQAALGAPRRGPAAEACARAERAFGVGAELRRGGGGLAALRALAPELRPFAFEGAGLVDALGTGMPGREACSIVEKVFLALGQGIALAARGAPCPAEPLLAEGHGFGEALVRPARAFDAASGAWEWDVGVGRALWFLHAGAVPRLRAVVRSCPGARQGALWHGVGRAAIFTGGGAPERLETLAQAAGEHAADVREGAGAAAELRRLWGRVPSDTPPVAPKREWLGQAPGGGLEVVPGIAAIRGVGAVSAAGVGCEALLAHLWSERTCITPIVRFPTDAFGVRTAALVPGGDTPPMDHRLDGRAQAMALGFARAALREALAQAPAPTRVSAQKTTSAAPGQGGRPGPEDGLPRSGRRVPGAPAGVTALVIGSNLEDRPLPLDALFDRLGDELGIDGPRLVVSTACASGTSAIGHALELLERGEADRVLVGGVDVITPRVFAGFYVLGALTERASPFSTPPGMTLGEGAAFLVLERALPDDPTCVLGYGLASDAFHDTRPAPDGHGVAAAVRSALEHADLSPDAIRYVNAHGTGTEANDVPEWLGIRAGLSGHAPPTSSSKGLLGHAQGAAGALEVVLTLLCRAEGLLPPTVGFGAPRAGAPPDPVPALRVGDASTFLSCSSAFGGVNAAVVVGPARAISRPRRAVHLPGTGTWGPEGRAGSPPRVTTADLPRGVDPDALTVPVSWLCAAIAGALAAAGVKLDRALRARTGLVLGIRSILARDGKALGDEIEARGLAGVSGSVFSRALLVTPAGAAATALGLLGPVDVVVAGADSGALALVHAATLLRSRPGIDRMIAAALDDIDPACAWGGAAAVLLATGGGRPLTTWTLAGDPAAAEARVRAGTPEVPVHRAGGRCEGVAAAEGLLAVAELARATSGAALVGGRPGLGWALALGGMG